MKPALAWHPYLDPGLVEHDLSGPLGWDRIGHRIHLAFALLWCFSLGWPTSVSEIAAIPLVVFSAVRTPNIWRTWGALVVQPVFMAIVAFAAWQMVTLIWSPDRHQGWKEIAANRWLWALWALWPVVMHRGLLLRAVALGFLCGNAVQLGQALAGESAWFPWHRMPGRFSGWWDPVVGGSMLCGVLGLHLGATAFGRGSIRWTGVGGAVITAAGIGATGTRGAWLAAGALVGAALIWWLSRARTQRDAPGTSRKKPSLALRALQAGLMVTVLAACAWFALRGPGAERWNRARAEVASAIEHGEYHSDTGARVLMAYWAGRAFLEHPAGGVGAGGFHDWTLRRMRETGNADPDPPIHAHAHNAALHIAATTGVVGLTLAGAVAGCGFMGASGRDAAAGPSGAQRDRGSPAPLLGMLGLLLAGLFDPVHLNSQTGALLAVFLAVSLVSRPAERAVP